MTRGLPLAAAALLLTACAHQDGAGDDGLSYAQRQARLAAVEAWDLDGTLIVDTGERRERVRVSWEQRDEQISLTIRPTVLGVASFRVQGDSSELVIEGRGETRVLADPERDLERELGWWVPVTSLEAWLLGRADADFPARINRGRAGTVASLDQRDWRVLYEEYQLANEVLVPRAITFRHGALELRLSRIDWAPSGG